MKVSRRLEDLTRIFWPRGRRAKGIQGRRNGTRKGQREAAGDVSGKTHTPVA